jgi:hypothetical protein
MKTGLLPTLCALLCVLSAGCSSTDSTTATTTTTSPSTSVTEAFSGTLQVAGRSSHSFIVSTTGTITVTITSLSVPAVVGLGIGAYTPSTGICSLSASVDTTTGASSQISVASAVVTATVDPGAYCVEIFDAGNLTAATSFPALTGATSFSLSIVHPT